MLLLVDDNDEFRQAAAEALEAAGLSVAQAGDAEEAFAIFQEEEISLLITDLRLPAMSGEELASRCLARQPALPLIVVSSHADADLPTRLGSSRIEILAKPFPLDRLAKRCIALLAGEPAESTGALPAAVIKKRQDAAEERHRPRTRKKGKRVWPFVAVATLAFFLFAGWLALRPAPLEAPSAGPEKATEARAEMKPLAPIGPIGELPRELSWQSFAGSKSYRIALRGVDEIVLWQGESTTTHIDLPAEVGGEIRPALAYYWSVEALSAQGERLAQSPWARFRFVPPSQSLPTGG